uniref:HNH nuclease domain-containing protein n=1 Tax=viral metagenome TaxID=1070528 RepID=A0A6M3JHL0_9ZZZZ
MAKKQLRTPNSRIRSALRRLYLTSRERGQAIKRDNYSCQTCGVKQSRKKGAEVYVEVHHKNHNIENWNKLFEAVREHLLCAPEELTTLCRECHKELTAKNKLDKLSKLS